MTADKGASTDVVEDPPTPDQLTIILEYLGPSKAGNVVKDATGSSDAMRKFKASHTAFQRPVAVDWNHGRAGTCIPSIAGKRETRDGECMLITL